MLCVRVIMQYMITIMRSPALGHCPTSIDELSQSIQERVSHLAQQLQVMYINGIRTAPVNPLKLSEIIAMKMSVRPAQRMGVGYSWAII